MKFCSPLRQLEDNNLGPHAPVQIEDYLMGPQPTTRIQVIIARPATLEDAVKLAESYDTLRYAAFQRERGATPWEDNRGEPMILDDS